MRTCTLVALGLVVAAASAGCAQQAGTLQAAAAALKAADIKTIEYTGTGKWYQFGQAPSPTLPWPPFDVSAYTASINYDTPSARIQMTTGESHRTRIQPRRNDGWREGRRR